MFVVLVTMTPGRVGKPCECTIREKTGNVLAHLLSYPFTFDVRGTLEKAGHLWKSPWQDPKTRPLAAPGLSPPQDVQSITGRYHWQ